MKRNGFTLIEVLVAIGIFGIILAVAANMFFTLLKGSTKTRVLTEVKQNGSYALNVMERMIRNSKGIVENGDGQTCEAAMVKLKIQNQDENTTEFDLTGPRIASNSGSYLTSEAVRVDTTRIHQFDCVPGDPGNTPDVVAITFTLVQAGTEVRSEEAASVDFETTIALRNY